MTLLSVQTSEHERPAYIGLTGISWGVGTVIGPIIGGALAQSKVTWRFAFYLNRKHPFVLLLSIFGLTSHTVIIFAVCLPIYIFLIPSFTPRPGVPTKKRLQHIDFVGTTLIIGAFTCGTMAVSFGGITYPWSSGRVIALFILSALFFIGFGVQQYFCIFTNQYDRVFPVPFLKNYEMLVFYAQTSCMATALFVTIYFLPLYFQFTRGDTPLEAGVRLLPFIVFVVVFCIVNGIVLSKHGLYMPWYLGSGILVVIGAALMFTVDENTSTAKIYGYTILIGAGSGAAVQMGFSLAQAKVPPEEIPLAIGFITNGQVTGVVVALAVANSIFLNQSTNKISALLPGVPTHEIQSAIAGVGSDFFESLSSANKAAVIQIIVGSISKTYILAITAGALSVVLSLFLKREKLFLDGSAGAA
jgi:MFS family permease